MGICEQCQGMYRAEYCCLSCPYLDSEDDEEEEE